MKVKLKFAITYPPHAFRWFEEIGIAVSRALRELGYNSEVVTTGSLSYFSDKTYDAVFVLAPHEYLKAGFSTFKKNPKTVYAMWELEQTPHHDSTCPIMEDKWIQFKKYSGFFDIILTESECKTKYINSKGVEAHTVPIGYHPQFKNIERPREHKKWDILFLGILFHRRKQILEQLEAKGFKVFHPPDLHNFFDPRRKAEIVARSRVCLNVHHNECNAFEKPRLIQDYMSNHAFVITEKIDHPEGFISGKHWIMADYNNLVATTARWLNKTQRERDRVAEEGFKYVTTEYTMKAFVEKYVGLVKKKRKSKF